jgi:hypothetical protein
MPFRFYKVRLPWEYKRGGKKASLGTRERWQA